MRSEEHTSELQSLMRNSYAVFCLKKKNKTKKKLKSIKINDEQYKYNTHIPLKKDHINTNINKASLTKNIAQTIDQRDITDYKTCRLSRDSYRNTNITAT